MVFLDDVGTMGLSLNYNLFYSSTDFEYDFNGNTYNNFEAYQAGSGQDAQSTSEDPAFKDLMNRDLHLSVNSPAINKGNPNFMPTVDETDIDGDARLMDGRVDIGADETDMTLPVNYLAPFRGDLVNGVVALHWQIGTMLNASHFEIQKSSNGRDWQHMGQVDIDRESLHIRYLMISPLLPEVIIALNNLILTVVSPLNRLLSLRWMKDHSMHIPIQPPDHFKCHWGKELSS